MFEEDPKINDYFLLKLTWIGAPELVPLNWQPTSSTHDHDLAPKSSQQYLFNDLKVIFLPQIHKLTLDPFTMEKLSFLGCK